MSASAGPSPLPFSVSLCFMPWVLGHLFRREQRRSFQSGLFAWEESELLLRRGLCLPRALALASGAAVCVGSSPAGPWVGLLPAYTQPCDPGLTASGHRASLSLWDLLKGGGTSRVNLWSLLGGRGGQPPQGATPGAGRCESRVSELRIPQCVVGPPACFMITRVPRLYVLNSHVLR